MYKHKNSLLVFAFFSGVAALIYEVVWFRKMHLVFGVSSYALSAVLSAFFLGLVLGSYFGGRFIDRQKSLKKIARSYAFVEIGIGVFALLVPFGLSLVLPVLSNFYDVGSGLFVFNIMRFILSVLVLVVPSAFIGATFPILVKLYSERKDESKKGVPLIYFFNTIGGAVGVFLAGFFLIRLYGISFSTGIAVFLNFAIAILAFGLSGKYGERESDAEERVHFGGYSDSVKGVLALFFVSGFTAIAYEVVWGRLLVLYSFGTIYATSILIGVFLLGIGLGSLVYHRFFRKGRLIHFVYLEMIVAVLGVAGFFAYTKFISSGFSGSVSELGPVILITGIVVFLPSIVFGIIFPLISNYVLERSKGIGRQMGVLYSLNTLGGIIGAFAAGFVFVPFFGLKGSIILLSVISLGVGIGGMFFIVKGFKFRRVIYALIVGSLILVVGMISPTQFFGGELKENVEVVYYEHGLSASVSVLDDGEYSRLYVDNQLVAADTPVLALDSKILGHLPLLLHEDPRKALTVGFGTGGTSYSMLRHDLERVDAIEIEGRVVETHKYFDSLNHGVIEDERLNVIIDDARSYLILNEEKYDVISTDVTNLRYYSNSNLYTKEYFELLRDRLNDGGIVAVWVPASGISEREQKVLMNSFREVFPEMSVWYPYTKLSHFFVYIGRENELNLDYGVYDEKFDGKVEEDLREVGITKYNLINSLFLDAEGVEDYVQSSKIHTDNLPVLEFPNLGIDRSKTLGNNLLAIFERKVNPEKYISGFSSYEEREAFLDEFRYEREEIGNNLIKGHGALLKGDGQGAAFYYSQAIEKSDYLETIDITE